jgi:hypothetical protein
MTSFDDSALQVNHAIIWFNLKLELVPSEPSEGPSEGPSSPSNEPPPPPPVTRKNFVEVIDFINIEVTRGK